MKNRLIIAVFFVMLGMLTSDAMAQELHCHRAVKKDNKSCKKEGKIHKKMFQDWQYKASKKNFKAFKKECKAEGKEYKHNMIPNHDGQ